MSGPADWLSLRGRVALVSGGAGGIGRAVVRSLAAAGADVFSADRSEAGEADGGAIVADVATAEGAADAVDRVVERSGRLDIVVHCAGIARDALISKMTEAQWSDVIAANLTSSFFVVRRAIPPMRGAGGGSIVLISSINADRGKAGQGNYAASKAGVQALARTAAREVGRFGIRVNAIAPGWIETPMTAGLPEALRQRARDETVLGRLGSPDDVAGAVLFLCSDLARHVTGQVLRVDGGQLIG
jgi:NAD(P)-dependent dehydrogenase (short-subunit alcohol dehydrogenase family)